ncbi:MAG: hypothetical protein AB8B69_01085, partial [Chitinophagales bacterium]
LSVSKHYQPDFVYTILTSSPATSELEKYITTLSTEISPMTLLVSGQKVKNVQFELPENVRIFGKMEEIIAFIEGV